MTKKDCIRCINREVVFLEQFQSAKRLEGGKLLPEKPLITGSNLKEEP